MLEASTRKDSLIYSMPPCMQRATRAEVPNLPLPTAAAPASKLGLGLEPMRLDAVVVAVILGVVRADCAFEVTELAHASCLRIVGGGTITMALVTVASGLPATFLRGLRRNRLRYVAAHPSTEYCEYNATLDASRPLAWTKVRALEQIFARADAPALAAWIDATRHHGGRAVVRGGRGARYARGHGAQVRARADARAMPNTGVLVARNTPWTRGFLRAVYETTPRRGRQLRAGRDPPVRPAAHGRLRAARDARAVRAAQLPTAATSGDFVCHHAGRRGAAAKYLAMVDAFRMGDINESKCCAQPCARTPG